MKRDPTGKGFSGLGRDGVLRTFDADHTILDARGLNPSQIQELLDRFPDVFAADAHFRGVDGSQVTSHEALFQPDPSILPKKPSPEEKAERRRFIEEQQRAYLEKEGGDGDGDGKGSC